MIHRVVIATEFHHLKILKGSINFMKVEEEGLSLVAGLIEYLKSDDEGKQIHAIHNLKTISETLGPERTRNELIPFLLDTFTEGDRVLQVLAEELGDFVHQVGGEQHASILIPLLESLVSVEDVKVKTAAVNSFIKIIPILPQRAYDKELFPLIETMTSSDTFTQKVSVALLYPEMYKRATPQQREELLSMFQQLVDDETVVVRRSATRALKDLVAVAELRIRTTVLMGMTQTLADSERDTLKLWIMDILIEFVKSPHFPATDIRTRILEIYQALSKDPSWRVQFKVAELSPLFIKHLPDNAVRAEFVRPYFGFFDNDRDSVVKTIAATNLAAFCSFLPPDTIVRIVIPQLKDVREESIQFREAFVASVMELSQNLSKEEFAKYIMPMITGFLEEQTPEVRASTISHLASVQKHMDISTIIQQITDSLDLVASDRQWRIRIEIIESFTYIAQQLGPAQFDKDLLQFCSEYLCDSVAKVRESTVGVLSQIAGSSTLLQLYSNVTKISTTPFIISDILPRVIRLTNDRIPNVRFHVVKALAVLGHAVEKPATDQILEHLRHFTTDRDRDVKKMAQDALDEVDLMSKPLIFLNSTKRELAQFKSLQRRLRSDYDVLVNKDDLSQSTISQCSVLVLGASRDKFTKKEVDTLWEFLERGGKMMVCLSEGGEPQLGSNINYFLEHFGIVVNNDAVISTVYCGMGHPKEAVIKDGVLNREVATRANRHTSTSLSKQNGKDDCSSALSLAYAYGATLEVQKPAVPLFSTGKLCYPAQRPVIAAVPSKNGKGRLIVVGSYRIFEDDFLAKEDNTLVLNTLLQYLLDKSFTLNSVDANDPHIRPFNTLPDSLTLASLPKSVLSEGNEHRSSDGESALIRVPINYTSLFDSTQFRFDFRNLPGVLQLYQSLGLPHEPLSLVPPEFQVPLPPFEFAVFPPQFKDNAKPSLELFDLDEEFTAPNVALAQMTNKCTNTEEDLSSLIIEAGDILGVGAILSQGQPNQKPDPKKVLEYIARQIIYFKCQNQSTMLGKI
ncbi:putative Intraflagellar transport protein 52 like protein [Blattamonas nauphoetae]|uniref:Intraflagellar transport protein 52 like protein n=1 Tax=Blattamonas nauphoetae TaxID=2049346 RepID=A0ABQ9Y412_9EUKA|nr:putative Intraflagellar transport protein 52 like protein [Blattamonas nauphoetae]